MRISVSRRGRASRKKKKTPGEGERTKKKRTEKIGDLSFPAAGRRERSFHPPACTRKRLITIIIIITFCFKYFIIIILRFVSPRSSPSMSGARHVFSVLNILRTHDGSGRLFALFRVQKSETITSYVALVRDIIISRIRVTAVCLILFQCYKLITIIVLNI